MQPSPPNAVEEDEDFLSQIPILAAMAQDVVAAFAAAIKTQHLFGQEHINTVKAIDNFVQRMTVIINRAGHLKLSITPTGVNYRDIPVLEVTRPQDSPFFALLVDGIGGLSFSAGIAKEELTLLLETMSSEFGENAENTAGTILWEANLPHIELLKLPSIGAGQLESDSSNTAEEFDDLVAQAITEAIDVEEDVSEWSGAVRLDNLSASQAVELHELDAPDRTQKRAIINILGEEEMKSFMIGLEAPIDGLQARFAQIALHSVSQSTSKSELLAARDALMSLVLDFISDGEANKAMVLASHCYKMLNRVDNAVILDPPRGREAAEAFTTALRRVKPNLEILKKLWVILPDDGQLLLVEEGIARSDIALLKALRAIAGKVGPKTTKFLRYQTNRVAPELAGELLLLSAQVLGEDAIEALRQGLQHSDSKVRMMAYRMLAKVNMNDAALQGRRLLIDPERVVRKDALTVIQKAKDEGAFFALRQAIESDIFKSLPQSEKSEFFVCSGHVNPREGLPMIREYALKSDVLARQPQKETRVAAIESLGILRDRGSRATLEEISKSLRSSGPARTAAQEAMRKL